MITGARSTNVAKLQQTFQHLWGEISAAVQRHCHPSTPGGGNLFSKKLGSLWSHQTWQSLKILGYPRFSWGLNGKTIPENTTTWWIFLWISSLPCLMEGISGPNGKSQEVPAVISRSFESNLLFTPKDPTGYSNIYIYNYYSNLLS